MLSRQILTKTCARALSTTTQTLAYQDKPPANLHAQTKWQKATIETSRQTVGKNYGNKDRMIVDHTKNMSQQKQGLIEAACQHEDYNLELITGIPDKLLKNRQVRVYKPSRNPMQSGVQNTKNWRIEFNNQERWENPIMGWGSTADPVSNVAGWLKFKTQEDAVAFCTKQGWNVTEVNDANVAKPVKRTYGDNFSWNKRTRVGFK